MTDDDGERGSFIARIAAFFRAFFNIGEFNDDNGRDGNATSTASTTLDGTAGVSATGTLDASPNINAFMEANVNTVLDGDER